MKRPSASTTLSSIAPSESTQKPQLTSEELDKIVTLLENDPRIVMEVIKNLHPENRRRLAVAGGAMEWFGAESAAQEVELADADKDRQISPKDFDHWFENALKRKIEAQKRLTVRSQEVGDGTSGTGEGKAAGSSTTAEASAAVSVAPKLSTLILVAVEAGLPFVGFGFFDNAVMILAGDAIDGTLGFYLHCSVLASAAMGNVCSGLLGMQVHGLIEKAVSKVCDFTPLLSEADMKHPRVFFAGHIGGTLGIMIGLLLGMLPLLVIDSDPSEKSSFMIFQKLDHNSSGSIELAEFVKCLEELGLPQSHDRAKHLLERYGDGTQIDFDQFKTLRSDLKEGKEIF